MLKYLQGIGILLICLSVAIVGGFKIKLTIDGYKQKAIKEDFLARYEERSNEIEDDGLGEYIGSLENYQALTGSTIAIIDISTIGLNVSVVEGVEKDDIKLNVGHYPQSDMPWVKNGNFAVAGHSSIVYNCLFNDLHKADIGMDVEVITQYGTYWYTISEMYVVDPTDVSCIERHGDGKNVITMTTCINSGKQRLIVVAEMKKSSLAQIEKLNLQ